GRWRWSIERFLRWWLGELAALSPAGDDRAAEPVRLVIGADKVLTTSTRIAVDSLPMVEGLLALEVEEQTPFPLAQVAGAEELLPDNGKQLLARVHVVPLRTLAEQAEVAGLDERSVDEIVLKGDGAALAIRPPQSAPTAYARARRARRIRLSALGAATLVLL